jgi:transposase InsO family protein
MKLEQESARQKLAQFRFAAIGPLLASPPSDGQLQSSLKELACRRWRHPLSSKEVCFSVSTLERWYYTARGAVNPVAALERSLREDRGVQRAWSAEWQQALNDLYRDHPDWSAQLLQDNLAVLGKNKPEWGAMPSYSTHLRYRRSRGWRRLRPKSWDENGAAVDFHGREVRSYEVEHVGGLWHLDFHHGSLKVLNARGQWEKPILLAILDDYSRLACHVQWYLGETASDLIHGFSQAILKRGLPRALLSDNGSAMLAEETSQGLSRLGILQYTTLPRSPYQNGKQEVFFSQVEGRLLAMLKGTTDLSLGQLNEATCAWVEMEYQRSQHDGIDTTPLHRFMYGKNVLRDAPDMESLRLAFTRRVQRKQRTSDGTLLLERIRFEIPSRFAHLPQVTLRYAGWDLSRIWMVDENTDVVLTTLLPLDKHRNADRLRRQLAPAAVDIPKESPRPLSPAPLLRQLMAEYAATGLPPAYIPKQED